MTTEPMEVLMDRAADRAMLRILIDEVIRTDGQPWAHGIALDKLYRTRRDLWRPTRVVERAKHPTPEDY